MPDLDTAVLEPAEPATTEEATPEGTQPDSATPDVPESPEEEAPDSGEEQDSYTKEQVAQIKKDLEARLTESHRRQAEAAKKAIEEEAVIKQHQAQVTQAARQLGGIARQDLSNAAAMLQQEIVKAVQEGRSPRDRDFPGLNPAWIEHFQQNITGSAFNYAFGVVDKAIDDEVADSFKGFAPDHELSRMRAAAMASRVPRQMVKAQIAYLSAAIKADPNFRDEVEKEIMEKLQADGKVSKLRDADEGRKNSTPRPSRASGTAGRGVSASEIIASKSSLEEKRAAYLREYGFDPVS